MNTTLPVNAIHYIVTSLNDYFASEASGGVVGVGAVVEDEGAAVAEVAEDGAAEFADFGWGF